MRRIFAGRIGFIYHISIVKQHGKKTEIIGTGRVYLESQRLMLRTPFPSDAAAIFSYRSLPKVRRYQGKALATRKGVNALVKSAAALKPNTPGTWYQLVIISKETGALIGDIGIHFNDEEQSELGYTLSPEHQRRGYATEAVIRVIDYLFSELNKHRITASADPKNRPSLKLLERIGMRREAYFRKSFKTGKTWADDTVYAVLKHEWPGLKKRHSTRNISAKKDKLTK